MSRSNTFRHSLVMVFIASWSMCCSSCLALYGIHQPRTNSKRFDLGMEDEVMLYTDYRDSLKTQFPNHPRNKDMRQPLQFWLYHGDTLIYATANCYAQSGLRNLHWDLKNDVHSPIPVTAGPTLWDHHLLIAPGRDLAYSDYHAIIVWSRFMGRQNRRFLRTVNRYLDKRGVPVEYRTYAQADLLFTD